MQLRPAHCDRGASLIEYAMLIALIALGSLGLIAKVGDSTSSSFDETATAFAAADGTAEAELTPGEKWEKAKEDYKQAIADAKEQRKADVAAAKAEYQAARQDNNSLPKDERKTANNEAKADYQAAKQEAKQDYQDAVQKAKDARAEAKAEYKATR
ncbi:MAG: hypothetical protein PVG83_02460 [Acidimicrobiia bacterium]|jgi:Flp pilus assembly pilin Flp